jgi:hypothetical protein
MPRLIILLVTISIAASASSEECGVYLQARYALTSIFSAKKSDVKLAMKVEAGSIEALHPGVIRRLIQIRERTERLSWPLNPGALVEARNLANAELLVLQESVLDRRLSDMIDSTMRLISRNSVRYSNSPDEQSFQSLLATLWELTMACAFSGEEIFLNKSISEIYSREFPAVEARLSGRDFKFDREIDIAILGRDGSWRWIEVKDWSPSSNSDRRSHRKVLDQSRAQDAVRRALKLDIKMTLLLKYGMNDRQFEDLRHSSRHDEIRFVFP